MGRRDRQRRVRSPWPRGTPRTVLAFVETSCTFPDTTARTDTDGVPTASIAGRLAERRGRLPKQPPARLLHHPDPHTVRADRRGERVRRHPRRLAHHDGHAVRQGGARRRLYLQPDRQRNALDRRRSPTFVEVVRTDCGVPATTSVTSLCHASESAVPTSSVPVERTATCSARWMRSRLSREGRTTLPPIARGGPLGEAARWKHAGPGGSLRSHECPTLPNPQPSLQP